MISAFWADRSVLVTGHTGFIGSWLVLWLTRLGARVTGVALDPPTQPNLFEACSLSQHVIDKRRDIRDLDGLVREFEAGLPEVVFHLAAQPLVHASYDDPVATYTTNVIGTAHVLEAARRLPRPPVVVVFTSDKCYENDETERAFVERDPLGGFDPYSSSKACAEIVAASYRRSYATRGAGRIATVRAGNVIGGGDWAAHRLIPDFVRAASAHETLKIRSPRAVRPWQHVLEPLDGCLRLAERLALHGAEFADAWNFGPEARDARTVEEVVQLAVQCWGPDAAWVTEPGSHPHEAKLLRVDASKARERLGWKPRWPLSQAVDRTIEWYRAHLAGGDMGDLTLRQIAAYVGDGRE